MHSRHCARRSDTEGRRQDKSAGMNVDRNRLTCMSSALPSGNLVVGFHKASLEESGASAGRSSEASAWWIAEHDDHRRVIKSVVVGGRPRVLGASRVAPHSDAPTRAAEPAPASDLQRGFASDRRNVLIEIAIEIEIEIGSIDESFDNDFDPDFDPDPDFDFDLDRARRCCTAKT